MEMFYVYVLYNKETKELYKGFTKNLKLRFEQHLHHQVKSTKGWKSIELIYYEACRHKGDAMRREKYFKTHYGIMYIKKRLKSYFTW
jgi:putative endonuclease